MAESYSLYLDDLRHPPSTGKNWVLVRTVSEMREQLELRGAPRLISFDYELGRTDPMHCGLDAVASFIKYLMDNPQEDKCVEIEVRLHTSSAYGEARMAALIQESSSICQGAGYCFG